MSWASTSVYYQLLNQRINKRLGGFRSAPILLASVDFEDIVRCQKSGDWQSATAILTGYGRQLERAGAELLLLCTNTMHLIADEIENAVTIPFLNIIDITALAIKDAGFRKPLLLATRYTMEHGFYQERMKKHGIEVIVVSRDERTIVHNIIFNELCYDSVIEESRSTYLNIIERAAQKGADSVILGCTEICLLVNSSNSPLPLFDTTSLHVDAAIEHAISGS